MNDKKSFSMDPISIGLGVGGIASNIFSNLVNQGNNDRNFEFAKRQQDFAERSFYKQMHFNSPVTQAKLLRAAGLNPALMNSGLAGSVSSASSGGSPSSLPSQALEVSGLNGLASNINLIDSQRSKNQSEAKNTDVMTETTLLKRSAEIAKILSDKGLNDKQREYYEKQRDFISKLLEYQGEKSEWENHNLRLEALNKTLTNEALTLQNAYLPMLNEAQAKSLVSSAYLNIQTGKMHGETINQIKQSILNDVIRSGILNNEYLKGLPEGLKGKELSDALQKHPKFRKFETALDLVLNRLSSLPIMATFPIK